MKFNIIIIACIVIFHHFNVGTSNLLRNKTCNYNKDCRCIHSIMRTIQSKMTRVNPSPMLAPLLAVVLKWINCFYYRMNATSVSILKPHGFFFSIRFFFDTFHWSLENHRIVYILCVIEISIPCTSIACRSQFFIVIEIMDETMLSCLYRSHPDVNKCLEWVREVSALKLW